MDRAAALLYLQNQFATITTELNLDITDSAAGYGPAIDSSLRALGFNETVLATANVVNLVSDYIELLEYFALRRLLKTLAFYADVVVDAPKVDKKRSQIFSQVNTLLKTAQENIENLGYGGIQMSLVRLELDYLEPFLG